MNTGRAEGIEAQNAAIKALADAAGRRLMLFVPRAESTLWSSPALVQALREFTTARAQREAQCLFIDVDGLARDHGTLIALAQRLPSHVLLRQADADFSPPANQAFVVNDRGGLLLFDSGTSGGATLTDAAERARPLAARFAESWERARGLHELRALGI
ncbi:DUF7931 domain-containing protein [Luteimonas sp. e5]